ncbi:hypothetical protein [Phenylobacterium sp.]|uniref:hypothetical protein n=1 Tax=Phenylobacterium sp. TaxID=1871053 RepID=UPI0040369E8A
MITKQTTFVLGAGFSYELRMPLGSELKATIHKACSSLLMHGARTPADTACYRALDQNSNRLTAALRTIREALDHHSSIDNLVHHFAHMPDVAKIAKVRIAEAILAAEGNCMWALTVREEEEMSVRHRMEIEKANRSGLKALLDIIMAGCGHTQIREAFANIGFVNFNYDRTLEHYVHNALRQRSQLSEDEAADVVEGLNIWRPYGPVGPLPLRGKPGVPFGAEGGNLIEVASSIRTYTEAVSDDELLDAREFLARSAQIIFLGCAYHRQNLELLQARHTTAHPVKVYGTLYMPPPPDPGEHAQITMGEFVEPARKYTAADLWDAVGEGGPARDRVILEPLTSRQLIEMYGPVWARPA